jgi:muramidase (phage lysozyme)
MINKREQLCEELYCVLAEALKEKLTSGSSTWQDLKVAVEFLKDNGITCDVKAGDPSGILNKMKSIPFPKERAV